VHELTDAVGYAAALIRVGEADVISGGADACVTPGMMHGFSRMRVVSTAHNATPALVAAVRQAQGRVCPRRGRADDDARARGSRPARGATIYASVDGYASTCDAFHRVQMAPDGIEIVRAMSKAIEKSGRACEEIGM
jgi:3-oxoacyl-[acyl-carrier-protein] synthase II